MNTLTTSLDSANTLTTSEAAFVGSFVGTMTIAALIFAVLVIIGQWKIFEKAGEKGWKCLIPIYGQYILFKIMGAKNWFWCLFAATILGSILMAVGMPKEIATVNYWAIDATIDYFIIDWSNHVPYVIGLVITCIVSLTAIILQAVKLAKAFGKGASYVIGLIFIPEIIYLVLGFGKAKYDKKVLDD